VAEWFKAAVLKTLCAHPVCSFQVSLRAVLLAFPTINRSDLSYLISSCIELFGANLGAKSRALSHQRPRQWQRGASFRSAQRSQEFLGESRDRIVYSVGL